MGGRGVEFGTTTVHHLWTVDTPFKVSTAAPLFVIPLQDSETPD